MATPKPRWVQGEWPWPGARRTPARCSSSGGPPPPQLPIRRSANYQPNSWNYGSMESLAAEHDGNMNRTAAFLTNSLIPVVQVDPPSFDKLKFYVRHLLLREVELLPKLRTIDTVQRLGVAYHFDEEISAILNSVSVEGQDIDRRDDVHLMTLLFRLLRQNNSPSSPELLLRSLKDGTGNFKKMLHKDAEGLLSLYEASHLAFEGEALLDEARVFSTEALRELMPSMHPHLRSYVDNALAVPLHWAAPRLQARWFIDHYAEDVEADQVLLRFAKLDFNKVQKLHQQELSRITRWWRNADLNKSLPFARDRLMECFYFATGVAWEPTLAACREVVAKAFSLIVVLDDIYDIYGTLDELVAFTNAIERWEATATEQLPEYMKAIYLAIFNFSNEEELKRGDAPSSIAIYMFEKGAMEHDARKAMRDLTMETWKIVNQDVSNNSHYPPSFANVCVNMARISHCIYQGGDGISAPNDGKKMEISELFLEPLKVNQDRHN
nr:unnamed protein product [Digitaria exilis]